MTHILTVTVIASQSKGREFEFHCAQECVIMWFFRSLQLDDAHENEINHDTPSQYPVLDKGSFEKIWLPSPMVYKGSLKL